MKTSETTCEKQVSDILFNLGFETHMVGYYFLLDAAQMMLADPVGTLKAGLTKHVYPEIGKKHGYTMPQVERSIRHSIERAFNSDSPNWQEFYRKDHRPHNGLFISLLTEVVRLKKVS